MEKQASELSLYFFFKGANGRPFWAGGDKASQFCRVYLFSTKFNIETKTNQKASDTGSACGKRSRRFLVSLIGEDSVISIFYLSVHRKHAAMAYTDDAVKAKLSALNETQESIVTVAQWVMFHR